MAEMLYDYGIDEPNPDFVTTSQLAELDEEICEGCRNQHLYERDGIGCEIQLKPQIDGEVPWEWAGGECVAWEGFDD